MKNRKEFFDELESFLKTNGLHLVKVMPGEYEDDFYYEPVDIYYEDGTIWLLECEE